MDSTSKISTPLSEQTSDLPYLGRKRKWPLYIKRKASSITNPGKKGEQELKDFISNEAKSAFMVLKKRKVILERGIMNEPPFEAYIKQHGWEKFTRSPGEANLTMADEFYANLRYTDKEGAVLCRGKLVPFSPSVINDYYELGSDPGLYEAYNKLRSEVHWEDDEKTGSWGTVIREITQQEIPLEDIIPAEKWSHIDKRHLATDMNVWYSFIASRLLPVTINSEVQWERIRLLYALKKGMAINVGKLIFCAVHDMLSTSSGIGFHSLITGLCHQAGCEDRVDDCWKSPMSLLTYEAFHRRMKQVPESSMNHPLPTQTSEGSSETLKAMSTRMERVELVLNYVRQLCEHTAKVLSYERPESIAAVGPFPVFPSIEDQNLDCSGMQTEGNIEDDNEGGTATIDQEQLFDADYNPSQPANFNSGMKNDDSCFFS